MCGVPLNSGVGVNLSQDQTRRDKQLRQQYEEENGRMARKRK